MKDWKTYAVVLLAAWCAWLTVRKPEERIVRTECADALARESIKYLTTRKHNGVSRHFSPEKDMRKWNTDECLSVFLKIMNDMMEKMMERNVEDESPEVLMKNNRMPKELQEAILRDKAKRDTNESSIVR